MDSTIWNAIAAAYSAELRTSTEDVHFGVGIPGNRELNLIPRGTHGVAIDLGCGSGENLVALSRLDYQVIGIDGSQSQLDLARRVLASHATEATLYGADACGRIGQDVPDNVDLVLSVGVAHFCQSLRAFIANCARLLKVNGILVLSVPHPVDMLCRVNESNGSRQLSLNSYFPSGGEIENAHYWQHFAGHIKLATGLKEYLCRPSDLVSCLLECGFEMNGMWEPQYTGSLNEPCIFAAPNEWFATHFYPHVPQYLIIRAILRERTDCEKPS